MEKTGNIIAMFGLLVIAIQDFRSRQISWWSLVLPASAFILLSLARNSVAAVGRDFLLNIFLLMFQLFLTWVWLSIRQRKISGFLDVQIGMGDVLFFISAAFLFSPLNYLLFYVCGLIMCLFLFILLKVIRGYGWKEIPLAGILAIPLIAFCCWSFFDPLLDPHVDFRLFSFMQTP